MQQDFDQAPSTLNDFPADPLISHDWMFWLIACVVVAGLAAIIVFVIKIAERDVKDRVGKAVDKKIDGVVKALSAAARAGSDTQLGTALAARKAIDDNFGKTLALSADLSKVIGKLNTALEGTKEEVAKPKAPELAAGGTVINIAVNDGVTAAAPAPDAGPYAAPAPAADKPVEPMTQGEQREAVWLAIDRLFNYWKNASTVTAAFRAAQQQLMELPAWVPPRELLPPGLRPGPRP